MADTALLKFARARDDAQFIWRIAAALTLEAQYKAQSNPDLSAESTRMMGWVLDNPMTPIDMMTAFAATMPEIADKVSLDNGTVDTANVLDSDIIYIVGAKWDSVATHRFGAA